MHYSLNDIAIRNKNYTQVKDLQKERVICSIDGELKILNCNPNILEEVLTCVEGNIRFSDIEKKLEASYKLDDIRKFLNTLVEEKILLKKTIDFEQRKYKILIIGKNIFKQLKNKKNVDVISEEYFIKSNIKKEYDFVIFAPTQISYAELIKINEKIYKMKIKFIPFYFNGVNIVVGPLIIPKETLCLQCIVSHDLKILNSKLEKNFEISLEDILTLNYSYNLNGNILANTIEFIGSVLIEEMYKFLQGEVSCFLDNRYLYNEKLEFIKEELLPTTYCDFCHGMNENYIIFNSTSMNIEDLFSSSLNINTDKLEKKEVKYKIGGYRSKTAEETKEILDKELKKLGTKVRIEEAIGNPFNDSGIIRCFNSFIEPEYNSNTNILFRKNEGAGKGLTKQQSYFSAGFELLEHSNLQYTGNIPIISAKYKDVKSVAIDLEKLASTIKNKNTSYDDFDENNEIDWVIAKSITEDKNVLVPAFLVFMYDVEVKGMLFPISSNGAAIGTTLEDAILHGLLEAIERDSWLLCQSNPYIMPIVDYNSIKNIKIKEIIKNIKKVGYDIITRDYTTDLGIPVYRTWILDKDNYSKYAYNGLGCHVSPELALERSITEAVQVDDWTDTEGEIDNSMITLDVLDKSMINIYNQHYLINKDIFGKTDKLSLVGNPLYDTESSYETAIKIAELIKRKVNGEVFYVDVTKPGMDIKVVRVIVTGDFQHMNIPLLSVSNRMFKFGINCGLSKFETRYEDLFLGKYAH